MVKFVAYKSVDNTDLSEIGLLQNIKKNLHRKGEGSSFDAWTGNIDMHAKGSGMLFILKKPVSGKLKAIDVDVGGHDKYELKHLSIKLKKFSKYFKGDYESKIFSGKDTIDGSAQKDKLAGYNGNDTISGKGGNDKIDGGKGNDDLYGNGGDDLIKGSKGKDFLDGGNGTNVLSGGADKDTFHFSSQLSSSNFSEITDFQTGKDRIELVKSVFPDFDGAKGQLSADKFIKSKDYAGEDNVFVYDKATGNLSYAVDSNNLKVFAEVTTNLNLKHTDLFVV